MTIEGILFDKDGTLFGFQETWGAWAEGALTQLARGDGEVYRRLARAVIFDPDTRRFAPESPVIAGTHGEVVALLAAALPDRDPGQIDAELTTLAARVTSVAAVPLAPLLDDLRALGYRLGVATNDAEHLADVHLRDTGVRDRFEFLAGYDSGHGQKPDPGMLLAFAGAVGLPPDRIVMVGDSLHDLAAGRAAGMATVGVLTGVADAVDLAAFADAILPDIGHLPVWLAGRRNGQHGKTTA